MFGALAWACLTDHRERRIPNYLTGALLLLGLLWHAAVLDGSGLFDPTSAGGLGWRQSALGAMTAFAIFFGFYFLKVYGAGDVKLLAATGAWVGIWDLLPLVLSVLLAGGLLALVRMIEPARRARTVVNLQLIGWQFLGAGAGGNAGPGGRFDPKRDSADRLPYAWAILAGSAHYALARYFGWWSWV